MWKTRVTELLGIDLPIIGGALQWLSRASLVASISNAEGLGVLASASFSSPEELREEIRSVRRMTDRPFAVNINLFPTMRPFPIVLLLRSEGAPMRALRNQTAQEILEMEARGASLEELLPKLSGLRGEAAYEKGDVNGGVFPCGQAAGLVKEVLPGKRGPRDMSSAPPGGSTLVSSASGSARIIPP